MRSLSIAAALALVPWATCSVQQQPLFAPSVEQPESHQAMTSLGSGEAPPYRNKLLSLHKKLILIPSISGNENEVGKFLVDYLADHGYHTKLQFVESTGNDKYDKERFNVLAWKGGKKPAAKVVVTSHIDVVPPHIPYAIDRGQIKKDTMIKGRGSVDAKGSVASMITALNQLYESEEVDKDDVMLVFVVGEEVGGEGMVSFSRFLRNGEGSPAFKAVIFGEPTENKLACGHKGGLFCDIRTKGVPGHSGYPWLGKSANELMVRALAKILDEDLGSSELFGKTTFNIGLFEGGVAGNVIPESALARVAARVAVGPEDSGHLLVKNKMQAIFDKIDKESFELSCSNGYGFVKCNCDVDGFEKITVNYGTDIPNLSGNHTRYLYGPGNILVAHGARENLTVADLEEAVEGYRRLIVHALKQ